MFTYKPKNNNLYSYVICDFKGMNMLKARKEFNKKKYEIGRPYFNPFLENETENVKYFQEFSEKFTEEDKALICELLWNFGDNFTKKQENYLIENSNTQRIIKTRTNLPKKKTTIRLEEAFLYTLLITENTDNFAHAIREAVTKYIIDSNAIKTLEKVNKILETYEIRSTNEFFELYR